MSRRKTAKGKREIERPFQLGDYWIGQELTCGAYYRYWYDEERRRTRRKSFGRNVTFEQAKKELAKLYLEEPREQQQAADSVSFTRVRNFYLKHRGNKARAKVGIRYALKLMTDYLKFSLKRAPMVSDMTLARQKGFMAWCHHKHNLSAKTISIYLSYIKASVNFCATPQLIIDGKGDEREILILNNAPKIFDSEALISEATGLPRSRPRDWIPTDKQLAHWIDCIPEDNDHAHIFRYVIMALNTWARPEAITDINVKAQVDFERDIIDLNPPGRLQNKKVRPSIRLTNNLRGWLLHWRDAYPIQYKGRPIDQVLPKTIKKISLAAATPKLTRYTLRHYMATRIRRVDGVSVTREQRAAWMGHTDPEHRTTEEWYESMDPDHLVDCAKATDAIMVLLDKLTEKSLVSPNVHPKTGFTIIENDNKNKEIRKNMR